VCIDRQDLLLYIYIAEVPIILIGVILYIIFGEDLSRKKISTSETPSPPDKFSKAEYSVYMEIKESADKEIERVRFMYEKMIKVFTILILTITAALTYFVGNNFKDILKTIEGVKDKSLTQSKAILEEYNNDALITFRRHVATLRTKEFAAYREIEKQVNNYAVEQKQAVTHDIDVLIKQLNGKYKEAEGEFGKTIKNTSEDVFKDFTTKIQDIRNNSLRELLLLMPILRQQNSQEKEVFNKEISIQQNDSLALIPDELWIEVGAIGDKPEDIEFTLKSHKEVYIDSFNSKLFKYKKGQYFCKLLGFIPAKSISLELQQRVFLGDVQISQYNCFALLPNKLWLIVMGVEENKPTEIFVMSSDDDCFTFQVVPHEQYYFKYKDETYTFIILEKINNKSIKVQIYQPI
jgi:hypothetical protein